LPVEFRLIGKEDSATSEWLQGFSHDIAEGGIGIFTNIIAGALWDKIKERECDLELKIHLPFSSKVISAVARPIWSKPGSLKEEARFFVGVQFLKISPKERKTLVRFAYYKNLLPKVSMVAFAVLVIGLIYISYRNHKVINQNRQVVKDLTEASVELSIKRRFLNQNRAVVNILQKRLQTLNGSLNAVKKDLELSQAQYSQLKKDKDKLLAEGFSSQEILEKEKQAKEKLKELQQALRAFRKENDILKEALMQARQATIVSGRELNAIGRKKQILEKVAIEDMYKWIKTHQNLRSGLIASFEGDFEFSSWAFTYDQALCVNVFLLFKDYAAAERILNFYATGAKVHKGGYLNAYYVEDGSPCEYIVHSGPNIWLGLSILRYTEATGNNKYLSLAERIARFTLTMQDKEGGIIGGTRVSWYATEHNLDAYAFFDGLYRLTKNKRYYKAGESVKKWLKSYSYTRGVVPVNRGKGDSTIATDTYAWSIASLGPARLLDMEMDPEQIIKFAVESCRVKTYFNRAGGRLLVEGFDFSRSQNLGRGGVISCEWTAQMILAFEIMAEFYESSGMQDKSTYYRRLAVHYLEELQKLIITSLSPTGQGRGCLPYASQDVVDTGHGWRTPSGMNTCSLAGTAYYIFAYHGYNPLNPGLSRGNLPRADEQDR